MSYVGASIQGIQIDFSWGGHKGDKVTQSHSSLSLETPTDENYFSSKSHVVRGSLSWTRLLRFRLFPSLSVCQVYPVHSLCQAKANVLDKMSVSSIFDILLLQALRWGCCLGIEFAMGIGVDTTSIQATVILLAKYRPSAAAVA